MIWNRYSLFLDASLKRLLTTSLVLSCTEVVPVLGVTFFVQQALNRAVLQKDLTLLIWDGAAMIGCTLWISLIALLNSRIALKANQQMAKKIYERIIEKTLRSVPFSQEKESEQSVVYDADKFHAMGTLLLVRSLPASFVSIAIAAFLCWLQPLLASFLLLGVPVFFVGSHFLEKKVRALGWVNQQVHERFGLGIRFLFEMMDLIQTQTAEAIEERKQKQNLQEMGRSQRLFIWVQTLYQVSQNFLIACISILVLIVGGEMVIEQKMPFGHLITFYIAVGMLKRYVQSLISSLPILIEGNLSLQKLEGFLKKPEKILYRGSQKIAFQGHLRLDNVTFGFGDQPLIERLSFSVQPGQIIALVGPNGCGKSTLVNLILGFLRPQKGTLYFDETPMEVLDLKEVRGAISVLRQNPLFFPGSLEENLVYGFAEQKRAWKEEASLHPWTSFVDDFPRAFQTPIGPCGVQLSGGQKQKLALARALLRNPKLLILDEPTNHLDRASLEQLLQALPSLKPQMAIILISHDATLTSYADQTLLLRNS